MLVIPVTEVQRATDAGDLQSVVIGRRHRYRPEDVRAWVARLAEAADPNRGKPLVFDPGEFRTPQAGRRTA